MNAKCRPYSHPVSAITHLLSPPLLPCSPWISFAWQHPVRFAIAPVVGISVGSWSSIAHCSHLLAVITRPSGARATPVRPALSSRSACALWFWICAWKLRPACDHFTWTKPGCAMVSIPGHPRCCCWLRHSGCRPRCFLGDPNPSRPAGFHAIHSPAPPAPPLQITAHHGSAGPAAAGQPEQGLRD